MAGGEESAAKSCGESENGAMSAMAAGGVSAWYGGVINHQRMAKIMAINGVMAKTISSSNIINSSQWLKYQPLSSAWRRQY
jgi:hypothetical protein